MRSWPRLMRIEASACVSTAPRARDIAHRHDATIMGRNINCVKLRPGPDQHASNAGIYHEVGMVSLKIVDLSKYIANGTWPAHSCDTLHGTLGHRHYRWWCCERPSGRPFRAQTCNQKGRAQQYLCAAHLRRWDTCSRKATRSSSSSLGTFRTSDQKNFERQWRKSTSVDDTHLNRGSRAMLDRRQST